MLFFLLNKRSGLVFWAAVALVLAMHSLTLSFSPMPWLDEVQIIEMGRNRLMGNTPSWSMIIPGQGNCSWSLYYVGGVAQECAYRLLGGAFGPRGLSLVGLALSTFLFFAILKKKGVEPALACGVALLFMVDPLVTQNVRGARVDIWTITLTLGSIILITRLDSELAGSDRVALFLVGALSFLQLFIWATAVFQLPLVAVEIWMLADRRKWQSRSIVVWLFFGLLGGACALGLLLLPLHLHGQTIGEGLRGMVAINPQHDFDANLASLSGCIRKTPFLSVAGGLALVCVRANRRYALVMIVGLLLLLSSWLYIHRFLQIMPLLVLAFGLTFKHLLVQHGVVRKVVIGWMCLGLIFGFGYSVLARNMIEHFVRHARDHRSLVSTLRDEIGSGGIAVYADTFQTYYAARELGWQQYRMISGGWWNEGNARSVMMAVDCFLAESVSHDQQEDLEHLGFVFVKTIEVPFRVNARVLAVMQGLGRPIGYGPYQLYRRVAE